MFAALLALFLIAVAADLALSAAVVYHLRKYTLPGWTAVKVVVPMYVIASIVILLLALSFLIEILSLGGARLPTPNIQFPGR